MVPENELNRPKIVSDLIDKVKLEKRNMTSRLVIGYTTLTDKDYKPVGISGNYLEIISVPYPFWLRFNSPDIVGLNERYIDRPCLFHFPFADIHIKLTGNYTINFFSPKLILAYGLTTYRKQEPQGYITPWLRELSCEENTSTFTPFFYTKPYERKTLYLFGDDSNLQYSWQVKKYKSDGVTFYHFDITALKNVPWNAGAPSPAPEPIMMDTLTDQIEEFRIRIKNNDAADPHKVWYWFECE